MGRKRRFGRPVDGVLLLNKPLGISSNEALQRAKRLFFASKAGHTGSLDPLATGVLPLCFGEATKFSRFLLDADKGYRSTFRFGVITATGDSEGEVISSHPCGSLTKEMIETALEKFRGDILQVPSMYSALKHEGKPLYELARKGIEIEREARSITIHQLTILAFRAGEFPEIDVEVVCSKGTYIRSLAEDIGAELGVGAHVIRLHRFMAGPFTEDKAITLDQLKEARGEQQAEVLDTHLMPVESLADQFPRVDLTEEMTGYIKTGQPVLVPKSPSEGLLALYDEKGSFIGIGHVLEGGRVAPYRLLSTADSEY